MKNENDDFNGRWRRLTQKIIARNYLVDFSNEGHAKVFHRFYSSDRFRFEEYERIYRITSIHQYRLPIEISFQRLHVRRSSVIQSFHSNSDQAQSILIMKLSDDNPTRYSTQKRVTILSPNDFSPSNIEQRRVSKPSDELRQIMRRSIRRHSLMENFKNDETLSNGENRSFRRQPRSSLFDFQQDSMSMARSSIRSIVHGFGLGTRNRTRTTNDQDRIRTETAPIYRLPSNKIDLDINENDLIRRSTNMKRKSDPI